jgi:predicted PP-loop superfamily ATPase
MIRRNFINGVAVLDLDGTWVLFREADAKIKMREQCIKQLNNKIYNLKRQLKRKRKEYKLRTKKPFNGQVKLTIQVSGGKFYSMSAKGLVKRLYL